MEYRLSPEELIKREAQKVLMEEIMCTSYAYHVLYIMGYLPHQHYDSSMQRKLEYSPGP